MIPELRIFPERAATLAGPVDELYWFLVLLSAVISLAIAGLVIFFAVRYRLRPTRQERPSLEGFLSLELTWTIIPFIISMGIFFWSADVFMALRVPPADSLKVFAVGKRWMWKMQHLEGRREINELHIPVGRPVEVTLTSEDVIHSFFVPAFRTKMDAVPGRYTKLWFEATRPGTYHLFCAEFCGSQHSRMIGQVIAMDPADFQAWLSGGERGAMPVSMAQAGELLFTQLGCNSCHQKDDSGRGPTLVGIAGTSVELADGTSVVADAGYLRESILRPQSRVTAGYQPIMPTFQGLIGEEDVLKLIAYIESLKAGAEGAPAENAPPENAPPPSDAAHAATDEAVRLASSNEGLSK